MLILKSSPDSVVLHYYPYETDNPIPSCGLNTQIVSIVHIFVRSVLFHNAYDTIANTLHIHSLHESSLNDNGIYCVPYELT